MSFVLLVEDDQNISESVTDVLEAEGHRVIQARDGRAALKAMEAGESPCVILLDLMMPGMSGDAVLDALQCDARLASVPVVLTSASPGAEQIAQGRVKEALRKPYSLDELLDAVGRYCVSPACAAR